MVDSASEATLIVNADDYGLSDGICLAVNELAAVGAISTTTLMVAADGALDRYRRHSVAPLTGRVGVHLQLTSGVPVSPAREVPTLLAPDTGRFGDPRTADPNPDEVELEWRRQIQTAGELLGGPPSHLDSHHDVHRLPGLTAVYVGLAREFGLAVRGAPDARDELRLAGVRGTTVFVDHWTGTGQDGRRLLDAVRRALRADSAESVVELVTHPGYNDPYLTRISGMNATREADFGGLLEFAALRAGGQLPGVRLGTHRDAAV
jgi:chitin disaccharide deacetylase